MKRAEKELVKELLSDQAGIQQLRNWELTLGHEMQTKLERLSIGVKEKPPKAATGRTSRRKSAAKSGRRKTGKAAKKRKA